MAIQDDLLEAAQAADPTVTNLGVMLVAPEAVDERSIVVHRPDQLIVAVQGATGPPSSAAIDAISALDLSPSAVAARALTRSRTQAISNFLHSNDPVIVACRTLFSIAFTRINDCFERDGLPRLLEPDLIAQAMTKVNAGTGDPPIPPPAP